MRECMSYVCVNVCMYAYVRMCECMYRMYVRIYMRECMYYVYCVNICECMHAYVRVNVCIGCTYV